MLKVILNFVLNHCIQRLLTITSGEELNMFYKFLNLIMKMSIHAF